MLRWLPTFQVATTCFSCSPADINLVIINLMIINVKYPLPTGDNPIAVNKYYYYIINLCHNLMNLELSRQIFKVISNIKLHVIPSSGFRVIPKG